MDEFRNFLQTILTPPKRKPKKPKRPRTKKIKVVPQTIQPDEFLTHSGKPFRFSRRGAKRPIEKRKR